jgi:hypothetical protein
MKNLARAAFLGSAVVWLGAAAPAAVDPIRLHPDNPHYFLWRGQSTVLVTSGEHYGAVLNPAFDYVAYLNALQADGLNLTRTFSGMYVEGWGYPWNTLNPPSGQYLCPWARSGTAGYADGGNKFNLDAWDPAYFSRLRDFVAQAGNRGIVVELVLFCAMYGDAQWNISPLKSTNNVNGVGTMAWNQVYTLSDAGMLARQDAMARKIVTELNGYDNVYYEICNEPYFGDAGQAWHQHMADTITNTENGLANRHLIAHNIANGSTTVTSPISTVSILNFHYSSPPDSVAQNYGLGRVIAFDETGFRGSGDDPYRKEAWDFIVAGGAVYSNLDWSFTDYAENGTSTDWDKSLGGGGPAIRGQLRILKDFIHGFDFVRMAPSNGVILGGLPGGVPARALVEPGRQYAIYLNGGSQANLQVDLPAGAYRADWVNTKTGDVDRSETFDHAGGARTVSSPAYSGDIALRILRSGTGPLPTGILREWWTGIGGTAVTDLTSSPAYPASPSGRSIASSFEAPTDWADSYGTRMRGWITAPISGNYTFWIASDDGGELWLSTDANPADRSLVARVPGWTTSREWGKYPEQQSAPIPLAAGGRYYVEALQKEGGGGDNLAVRWQLPDGTLEGPIPGSRLDPVDPFDSDGDGTSDADEFAAGTDPYDSSNGASRGGGGGGGSSDGSEGCGLLGMEGVMLLWLLGRRRL